VVGLRGWGAVVLLGLLMTPAHAITRIWISGHGTDASGCGAITAPCRTLQYAHDNVAAGGEVDILDPAGYGSLIIDKAINIINANSGAGTAGVLPVGSGDAITINAGPTDQIVLNGLQIEGLGTGGNGITVNSAGSLGLGAISISGFTGYGINFIPNNGSGGSANLSVGAAVYSNATGGVFVKPSGGTSARATFSGSLVTGTNSSTGAAVTFDSSASAAGFVHAIFSDCVIRNSNGGGIVANGPSGGGQANIEVYRSALGHMNNALVANGANAIIELNLSSISNVTTVATVTSSGLINTYGNNGIGVVGTIGPLNSIPLH
jgi:hypothetical protein